MAEVGAEAEEPAPLAVTGLKIVDGDLLDASEGYIVHQCNCRSYDVMGLAAAVFARFPSSNTYKRKQPSGARSGVRSPGSISVHACAADDPDDDRSIVNLYGQVYPGRPGKGHNDTAIDRLRYFESGLGSIAYLSDVETRGVAFPFEIGCGLAHGNWSAYRKSLEAFAARLPVTLYKLEV